MSERIHRGRKIERMLETERSFDAGVEFPKWMDACGVDGGGCGWCGVRCGTLCKHAVGNGQDSLSKTKKAVGNAGHYPVYYNV